MSSPSAIQKIPARRLPCGSSWQRGHDLRGIACSLVGTLVLALGPLLLPAQVEADPGDWPTHRADLRRSGVVDLVLEPTRLTEAWSWQSPVPVRSAWPAPAKWDAYAALAGMKSMRNYDPVIQVTAVQDQDGDALFLAGPTDDTVRRLDASTGELVWSHTADGPVRIAPTWHDGTLYFGSDDGFATALDARTGAVLWRRAVVEDVRLILNNGRMISPWPVRTGVHVLDGTAYCAASFLPWESTHVAALDARTGAIEGPQHYVRDLGAGWTMEGPLLLSEDSIIVPQGRVAPLVLDRATGEPRGALSGGGGSFVLLTEDDGVLHGPGNKGGWITDSDGASREKIASYQRGNAMIVDGPTAWMLADETLSALDRPSGTLLWSVANRTPLELIKSGNHLFAGGEDTVAAYEASTGTLVWDAPVDGNAFGLVLSGDRLIVSTDEGRVHVFETRSGAAATTSTVATAEPLESGLTTEIAPPPIEALAESGLLDRWVFREDLVERIPVSEEDPRLYPVVPNEVAGRPVGRFRAFNTFVDTPMGRLVRLDGASNDLEAATPGAEPTMPKEAFTAAAVVRIDAAQNWGGLLSAVQDNGPDETGWVLGYRNLNLGLGLRTSGPDDRMTWILDPQPIEAGTWHVVAVRYDGSVMRLWVDGRTVAESDLEQGAVVMPERYWYALGAYHDDDEYFVTDGALAELRLYDEAVEDAVLERMLALWQPLLALPAEEPEVAEDPGQAPSAGPIIDFNEHGVARIRWETAEAVPTRAVWMLGDEELGRFTDSTPRRAHVCRIEGLRRNRIHQVQLGLAEDAELPLSRAYQLDTSFDYTRRPVPGDVDAPRALDALTRSEIDRGLALVLGSGDPTLALTLARRSRLNVLCLHTDPEIVARLRAAFLEAGVYGERVQALVTENYQQTALPVACANLVLLDDAVQLEPQALNRLLVPRHGVALRGDDLHRAPATPGAGVWTHMYGTPDNSGYGGETLGGIHGNERLALQWIGRPGPRYQSDRGNRKPAPLAAGGRLYMQGLNRIIAVDDHNGTILWALELPEVQRFNMPRDTSNWCADEDHVFVAGPRLLVIDGRTGALLRTQSIPGAHADGGNHDWGYVARTDELLLGSTVRKGSSHTGWWGAEHWYDGRDNFSILKVCSDTLFATEPDSGSLRWEYQPDGLIINPTITVADGRVVFLEAGNQELVAGDSRKLEDVRLWSDVELVTLDEKTGEELWRRPARPMPGRIAVYTAVSNGILYLQTSDDGAFALYAFDLETGRSLWRHKFDWEVDHHGKHLSRIAVAEGLLYLRPYVLDARTGELLREAFPQGHQCGNYACTSESIFLRAGDLTMWSPREDAVSRWQRVRPDCWISTIPANGMVLSPEGGGGCSCGSWIETSMAFRPVLEGAPGRGLRRTADGDDAP